MHGVCDLQISSYALCTAADNDYNSELLLDINLSSSTTSTGECISATVLPDTIVEGDETFTLSINSNVEGNISPTMSQALVVIVNDDSKFVSHESRKDHHACSHAL